MYVGYLNKMITKSTHTVGKYSEYWSFDFKFDDLDYRVQFSEPRDEGKYLRSHSFFNLYIGEYADVTNPEPTAWHSIMNNAEHSDAIEQARKLITLAKVHAMMTA